MGYPQNRYRLHVVTARIRLAEGDLDGALDALHEAQRLYMPDFIPDVRPLPAQEARILLRHGRLAEANAWARARGLAPQDDLTYLHEFEHVTLARVLLAQSTLERSDGSARDALALLGHLLRAGGGWSADGQRHRNPCPAGACPPGARRHACRSCRPRTCPDRRRTGRLCARLPR